MLTSRFHAGLLVFQCQITTIFHALVLEGLNRVARLSNDYRLSAILVIDDVV